MTTNSDSAPKKSAKQGFGKDTPKKKGIPSKTIGNSKRKK